MKTLAIWGIVLAFSPAAHATTFDLGQPGRYFDHSYVFSQYNNVSVNGQTLSFDINFNNSVHLFANTLPGFEVGLNFGATGSGDLGFITGSAYILNSLGAQMSGVRPLGSGNSYDATNGQFILGLFPLYSDASGTLATDIIRPFDFYGVHFDLTLPNDDFIISSGELVLRADHFQQSNAPFRIGPHVPENGNSFFLLAFSFVMLAITRYKILHTVSHR